MNGGKFRGNKYDLLLLITEYIVPEAESVIKSCFPFFFFSSVNINKIFKVKSVNSYEPN